MRKRDARGRFVKETPTLPQPEENISVKKDPIEALSKNNEHDSLHQTLRQVNRLADGGEEPSVKKAMRAERVMERTPHWLFVAFIVWVLWELFVG